MFSLVLVNNANYILGNKLAYFRDRFEININRCTLTDNIKKIKLSTVISDDEQLIISNFRLLILVKSNQYSVQGFDVSEIGDIITFYQLVNCIVYLIILYTCLFVIYSFYYSICIFTFTCLCYLYTIYYYVYDRKNASCYIAVDNIILNYTRSSPLFYGTQLDVKYHYITISMSI